MIAAWTAYTLLWLAIARMVWLDHTTEEVEPLPLDGRSGSETNPHT